MCGIPEDARRFSLAHHLCERVADDMEAITTHIFIVEGRTFIITHRRQLGSVTHQDEPTPLASIDEVYKVVKQTPRAVAHPPLGGQEGGFIGNHGGFITNEEKVLPHVEIQREDGILVDGFLTVDAFMNGEGGVVCIEREDLGGTPCWCHQHTFSFKLLHRLDEGTDERCFSCACKTSENEHRICIGREDELAKRVNDFFLVVGRFMPEMVQNKVF